MSSGDSSFCVHEWHYVREEKHYHRDSLPLDVHKFICRLCGEVERVKEKPDQSDYINDCNGLDVCSSSSTWQPPTKEECERRIIGFARKLMKCRWWQDKSYIKQQLKYYCEELEKFKV